MKILFINLLIFDKIAEKEIKFCFTTTTNFQMLYISYIEMIQVSLKFTAMFGTFNVRNIWNNQ